MKKYFGVAIATLFVFAFISCSTKKDEGGMSDRAKKNLEGSQKVAKGFLTGDTTGIRAVIADEFVDHTDKGDMNRDSLLAMINMMHKMNNDMKMETIWESANDDYVMSWYRFSGTSDGSMGMPKGPYDFPAIEMVKFNKDSKAIEHWEYMEPRVMMKMMPPPQMENKTDSTKKNM